MSTNTTRVNNPMKVITGPDTRWSYANVWEPKSINGGTPKYSVSLIIPKSDTKTVAKIKAAIEAAYQEGQSKLKGNSKSVPPLAAIKTPLRDGDIERPDDPAYPDKDSICIVDTPTGYEFYVCTWLNVQNDDIDNSDNVLATYGLPESFEKMEILSKDFTYLFTVEDASVTEAIFEILSGKSNIGLEANERRFAQAWYDAYGNDDVYYSEEAGHCVYRSVSSDEEPTTYTDDEGNTVMQNSTQDTSLYDKAHELWTKGERLIEITTTKGYQLTIDYFPSIQVFICSNGYYELSAADIETLSQLLQITD